MAEVNVADKVKQIFADYKKIEPADINTNATFEELGFDSLDGLNIIFELEEAFDIVIPDEKAQEMRSVGQIIEEIEALLEAKAGGVETG